MNELLPESGRAKRTVLVIEDNAINREMLKEILAEQYHVLEAEDGLAGMELLRTHLPELSLVLLDVQMPKMNGYEFLEQTRNDPLLASIPVIVTTGSTISEDEERCLAMGASDFITKPYNPRIILRRMEAIIRLRESIATLQAVEYDPLTGLYEKSAFQHHFQRLLRLEPESAFDLLLINVEGFNYLNERFGEAAGNELLRHIADCIRTYGTLALLTCRYHADRFLVLRRHMDCDPEQEAAEFDAHLHENSPIRDFVVKYAVYYNIPTELSPRVIIHRLGVAVKTIEHQYDRTVALYDQQMTDQIERLHAIESCMEDALQQQQFQVWYQPKHDPRTGRIAGAEALVRWIHPEYGFMQPASFIPLFEKNGFITKLDLHIWRTVCRDLNAWRSAGLPLVPVSVNASRRDFLSIEIADAVLAPVLENEVDRSLLHVEITESLGISDQIVKQKVEALHDLGFQIELDDFGSGQSSLSSLRDIPMDIIKLDMSFTRTLEQHKQIVQMVISLAHALGHRAVAEGIETEQQKDLLRDMGCDYIQGYYYSKPLPEADFRAYLKKEADAGRTVYRS